MHDAPPDEKPDRSALALCLVATASILAATACGAHLARTLETDVHPLRLAGDLLGLVLLLAVPPTVFLLWKGRREATRRARELEARVNESTSRLEAILDNSPAVIYAKDREGRYLLVNRHFETVFGTTQERVLGRTDHEMFPPDVADAHRANDLAVLERGPLRFEEAAPHADGSHTYVVVKFPLANAGGRTVAVCGIATDITDRKLAEGELRRAMETAEAATRAKSEFLANMSHEIRTPLNAVIGMTGLLLDTELDAEQRDYAQTIREGGEALLAVIDDILDFSRIESGKLRLEDTEFRVREVVEQALDVVAPQADAKKLELACRVERAVPADVFGDAARVRQVLLNLLANALKFTSHGEVSLRVDAEPATGTHRELRFSVRDTGVGIPPDRRDRLFQSFSQVDASTTRRHGGSGLGLAICKALVEMMGGRIWVTSEPGRGSEFQFTISVRVAPPHEGETTEVLAARLAGRRVLVVDDNDTGRGILQASLEDWGMRVTAFASPSEALAWVRTGEPYDVAVVDQQMPDMDGVALAAAMAGSRDGSAPPTIVLGAVSDRPRPREGSPTAIAAFLSKPVKPGMLLRALTDALQPSRPDAAGPSRTREADAAATLPPMHVLVAEDNMVGQKVTVRILERLGCRVDVAATGLEVLAAIDRRPYDVVLMDLQMPEMDGLATTVEIHRRLPADRRPRIVALTANARREDEAACRAAGMDGFLSKPVESERLSELLAELAPGREPVGTPLDDATFDQLRRLERDAPGMLREIVDLYLEDTPRRLAALRTAAAASDVATAASEAHSLKGSSGYIGARELATLAGHVERHARAGDADGVRRRVEELDEVYARLRDALSAAGATEAQPVPFESKSS